MSITTVSSPYSHTLVVSHGRVYSFGINLHGQLGLGDKVDRNVPTLIPNLPSIKSVSAGISHSLFLDWKGQVYSCGHNDGELGLPESNPTMIQSLMQRFLSLPIATPITHYSVPTHISNLPRIRSIIAGLGVSFLIDEQGGVYAFGNDAFGQLGLGASAQFSQPSPRMGQLGLGNTRATFAETVRTPTLVPNLPPIRKIATSGTHTIFLTESGQVYTCGVGVYGQLGIGDKIVEIRSEDYVSDIFSGPGPLPVNIRTPMLVPGLSNIVDVAAGTGNTLVLNNRGQVYDFGLNYDGQLGLGDQKYVHTPTLVSLPFQAIKISLSSSHSLFLDRDNHVWGVGEDNFGQLGQGDGPRNEKEFMANTRSGTTSISRLNPILVSDLPIVEICSGSGHTILTHVDGSIYVVGFGGKGVLGLGRVEFQPRLKPIPNLIADIPPESPPLIDDSSFNTRASYQLIEGLLKRNKVSGYRIIESIGWDSLVEFVIPYGRVTARVHYDPTSNLVFPPEADDVDYDFFNELFQNNQLKMGKFRSDIYEDELGNKAFEYVDMEGNRYLALVHLDSQLNISEPIPLDQLFDEYTVNEPVLLLE